VIHLRPDEAGLNALGLNAPEIRAKFEAAFATELTRPF
jgi:hypothetical protein